MRDWLILTPPTRVLPTQDGVGRRSRVASLMKHASIQYKLFKTPSDGIADEIGQLTLDVFVIHDHPHRREPLVETNGGILHARSGLQRELRRVVFLAAVPTVVFFEQQNVVASALRASNAIRPTPRNEVVAAVRRVFEVEDCFLKGFG